MNTVVVTVVSSSVDVISSSSVESVFVVSLVDVSGEDSLVLAEDDRIVDSDET